MAQALHAIDFLKAPAKHPDAAICVAFGDDLFLRRLVCEAIAERVLGTEDAEFSLGRFDGSSAEYRTVFDELSTVAMFGSSQRLVIVDNADEFVSRFRGQLEDYVARPRTSGVLLLCPKTWASNTRLYKAIDQAGLQIDCKSPTAGRIAKFLVERAKKVHGAVLDAAAAEAMVEMVGPELGLLDQQVATLALIAGAGATIGVELVQQHVGSWRAKTAWEMLDLAAGGDAKAALEQLDRLLTAGEHPIAILAQISATLRRFAAATRYIQHAERAGRRANLREALEQAGFKSFVVGKAEQQLKKIGRQRAAALYQVLLETDLALKGQSSAAGRARLALERLLVRDVAGAG
ncbi:MAG: DNA polymerase III subunit delta [Pirellulales bacterium]